MKICLVAEGCYPYVVGGVSSWIHSMIQSFPNVEFIVLTIVSDRSMRGKFKYELPINVTAVYELYLNDKDWFVGKKRDSHRGKLSKKEYLALYHLLMDQDIEWDILFDLFQSSKLSLNDLLMGESFLKAAKECYEKNYSNLVFSDFLWTLRSIYLPLFLTLKMKVPKADLYHCVATGYAGILGCMAQYFYGCRLMVSEHGIYTREREEELIKANWVKGIYKDVWISQFKKMSRIAYQRAQLVTSLYEYARQLQIELGCPPEKIMVTPNGIDVERLSDLPGKSPQEEEDINVGAILRVAPIKDVKTLIQAFHIAKEHDSRLKLWIMGPVEEEKEYAEECFEMVELLRVRDVIFTGRVDIRDYLGKMDMTILTSISEGQPLTILESYAAGKPVIATDVGNCNGLIYGENDNFGAAGILTHIMNIEEISQALLELAQNPLERQRMGQNGYQRLMSRYKIEDMHQTYEKIYRDFAEGIGTKIWQEKTFIPVSDQEMEEVEKGREESKDRDLMEEQSEDWSSPVLAEESIERWKIETESEKAAGDWSVVTDIEDWRIRKDFEDLSEDWRSETKLEDSLEDWRSETELEDSLEDWRFETELEDSLEDWRSETKLEDSLEDWRRETKLEDSLKDWRSGTELEDSLEDWRSETELEHSSEDWRSETELEDSSEDWIVATEQEDSKQEWQMEAESMEDWRYDNLKEDEEENWEFQNLPGEELEDSAWKAYTRLKNVSTLSKNRKEQNIQAVDQETVKSLEDDS